MKIRRKEIMLVIKLSSSTAVKINKKRTNLKVAQHLKVLRFNPSGIRRGKGLSKLADVRK